MAKLAHLTVLLLAAAAAGSQAAPGTAGIPKAALADAARGEAVTLLVRVAEGADLLSAAERTAAPARREVRRAVKDRLEVTGLVADKRAWTLAELRAMPQTHQVTRHICVEGWSAIGKWSGVPFASFLRRVGADLSAKYVGFKCADDYYTSIDMPTALHPQTLLALTYDSQPLPPRYGFPMKLRMPTKLGYKNPKHIQAIFVTNNYPGGYWEDQGYNWFGGS